MVSVISKVIGLALVLLLGCVVWLPSAVAQDEPIETLEGMEVSGTVSVQEERKFSIPKPDTTTIMPLSGLIAADIPKTHTVSQDGPKIVRIPSRIAKECGNSSEQASGKSGPSA